MRKLTKNSRITLIELPATQFGILNGDLSVDIYTGFRLPGRSIHALEAVLRTEGWIDVQSINPLYHGKKGKLTEENFRRIWNSDVLLISAITRTAKQSIELAEKYKSVNGSGLVIAGGPDPTFRTEDWIRAVDIIVRGEGEKTISELMGRLTESFYLEDIEGVAFKDKITDKRKLLTSEELSQLPHPYYDEVTRKKVGVAVMETTRGCPNYCDFCSVSELYGGKYRIKSVDYVIDGLKDVENMGIAVFFTDDSLVSNTKYSLALFDKMAELGLNKRLGNAQVNVMVTKNPKIVEGMKKAGIKSLCVGIESLSDETLEGLGKPYSAEQNRKAIKILREEGFWIHGMMMVGGEGDTPETLREATHWINQNLDSAQLFAPIPLPGTKMFKKVEEEGRILSNDYSLYDGIHVVSRPKHFTPYELQLTINKMYEDFYSVKKSFGRLRHSPRRGMSLALLLYTQLSGAFRKCLYDPQSKRHLEFLKSVS